jgi:DNA-binding MarR family transcriptional regulator
MDDGSLAVLRRLHRTVTARVGTLEDGYLGRGRPLAECRLLWEIGTDGADLRDLRSRLGLDSGYLSRLVRSLERQALVAVSASPSDRRVRTARLTRRGLHERAELDRLSNELVGSILAPLDEHQRRDLLGAASTVERLFRASEITIAAEDPTSADARWCIGQYFDELGGRFAAGFDPERSIPADDAAISPPSGVLLLARRHDRPVGCGALKHHPGAPSELKRMWVDPAVRGLGLGRRLLRELEHRAAAAGAGAIRLETNRALGEAIALYRSSGYEEVEPFNTDPYAHHWFEKRLDTG